jgi:hypothetical protein
LKQSLTLIDQVEPGLAIWTSSARRFRYGQATDYRYNNLGFRVVRALTAPSN